MKKILSFLLLTVMVLTLASCSGGIKGDEAKAHINSFLDAIEAEDYKAAEELLHPERPGDIEEFIETTESDMGLDFSSITVNKYTNFRSSYYDSTVAGSAYVLVMEVDLSGTTVKIEAEVVKNDAGFGIYNFDVTP